MTRAPCLQSQQPTFDRSQDRYEWQLLHTKSSKSPKSTHELEYSRDSLRTIKSLFGELTSHERLLFTKWKWRKYHTVHIADVQEKLILFCQCHWRKYETVPFLWLGVFYDNNQLIFRKLRTPKSLRQKSMQRKDGSYSCLAFDVHIRIVLRRVLHTWSNNGWDRHLKFTMVLCLLDELL